MNNKQRHQMDKEIIGKKAQELLTYLENPDTEKSLDAESKEIISRIAELSKTAPFDAETQYVELLEKIKKVKSNKRNIYFYQRVISGVAAVVLIFIVSIIWLNFSKKNIQSGDSEVNFSEVVGKKDNVLLTLSDGTTVELTEKDKMSISPEDSIFKENHLSENGTSIAQAELKFNTLVVPKSKDFKLLLPDGTVVNINSDSKIKFPDKFSDTERLVILEEGEAFFDVAKDKNKPFIVQVKDSRIQVLGTSFNINAYPETNMKTTLVEGKVKISSDASAQEITLTPGQQAELNQGLIQVKNVDVSPYIAWTKGLFMFNNLDLNSIMKQLNRWYNIDVTFADSSIENYTFTGVINKKYSKEYIFSIIEKTTQIKIEVKNGNEVFISK